MANYILLENGDKIIIEDESGFLLLDNLAAPFSPSIGGGTISIGSAVIGQSDISIGGI